MRQKAFSIIELMVSVVVIGILAALIYVSYQGVTTRAAVSTITSDLTDASDKLKFYYQKYNVYPTALDANGCPSTPVADTTLCLKYSNGDSLGSYFGSVSKFTLKIQNSSNGLVYRTSENDSPVASKICPSGFIDVPGSATYGTSDFCVMKYEAKCAAASAPTVGLTTPNTGYNTFDSATTACTSANSLVVVSVASGYPIGNINQATAIAYGASACSGCHLMSEAEWMTLAQNVLSVPGNWSGGAVGVGYIYSGHNDSSPNTALAADTNDSNGYYGENNTGGNQRRTLTLSNGQVIWDMAGNVAEWTQGQTTGGEPGSSSATYSQWTEWPNVNVVGSLAVNPFPSGTGLTGSSAWNSAQGIGELLSNPTDNIITGFIRSGGFGDSRFSGIMNLSINPSPSSPSTNFGLRSSY